MIGGNNASCPFKEQEGLVQRCGLLVIGRAPLDVIGVRNAAHQDGLLSSSAMVGDGKSAIRIKED